MEGVEEVEEVHLILLEAAVVEVAEHQKSEEEGAVEVEVVKLEMQAVAEVEGEVRYARLEVQEEVPDVK